MMTDDVYTIEPHCVELQELTFNELLDNNYFAYL